MSAKTSTGLSRSGLVAAGVHSVLAGVHPFAAGIASLCPLVIPSGDLSRTITVLLIDDLTIDGTKTLILDGTVTSGNAQNTTLSGTLTINDDDTGVVSVSTTTPFVAEPSATGLFFISMSNQSSTDTFITYTVTNFFYGVQIKQIQITNLHNICNSIIV